MKLYSTIASLPAKELETIIKYFSNACDKINIYFPNDCSEELSKFKEAFLSAIDLQEMEDELSTLEPKEGFTMIIASLSDEVCNLLLQVKVSYHLSFGLIKNDTVVLYAGDEGELVLEDTDPELESNPLFGHFKVI